MKGNDTEVQVCDCVAGSQTEKWSGVIETGMVRAPLASFEQTIGVWLSILIRAFVVDVVFADCPRN